MKTFKFKTAREFKKAFNTVAGKKREGQLNLDQIVSINGEEVNTGTYNKRIINITKSGPDFFDDDVKFLSAPYTVIIK
jgi:hypothetical protein